LTELRICTNANRNKCQGRRTMQPIDEFTTWTGRITKQCRSCREFRRGQVKYKAKHPYTGRNGNGKRPHWASARTHRHIQDKPTRCGIGLGEGSRSYLDDYPAAHVCTRCPLDDCIYILSEHNGYDKAEAIPRAWCPLFYWLKMLKARRCQS
jgi:hypothetical protein